MASRALHRHRLPLLLLLLLAACNRGPSREEALAAIRAVRPSMDSVPVAEVVWLDGPPWFSCAEVIAKLRSGADSTAVRRQVGNWHDLVRAGWLVVRDTAIGAVADPGWCAAQLTPQGARQAQRWEAIGVAGFPTGALRRGWSVPVGTRHIAVERAPRRSGDTVATAEYLLTVSPNVNGRALGAARDTIRSTATLVRREGRWVVRRPAPGGR